MRKFVNMGKRIGNPVNVPFQLGSEINEIHMLRAIQDINRKPDLFCPTFTSALRCCLLYQSWLSTYIIPALHRGKAPETNLFFVECKSTKDACIPIFTSNLEVQNFQEDPENTKVYGGIEFPYLHSLGGFDLMSCLSLEDGQQDIESDEGKQVYLLIDNLKSRFPFPVVKKYLNHISFPLTLENVMNKEEFFDKYFAYGDYFLIYASENEDPVCGPDGRVLLFTDPSHMTTIPLELSNPLVSRHNGEELIDGDVLRKGFIINPTIDPQSGILNGGMYEIGRNESN